jgi:heme a synthase
MVEAVPVTMQRFLLHRYAIVLSVCTLLLVIAGATVTSKEAGLSVPDWPLSYGQLLPPMTGGVLFEHGHRMIGATVGLLTIGMLVWILRVENRAWMRKLGWIALAWVSTVGLLGGLTVKLLTPPPVSITHTCLAQLFFALTVSICVFTSSSWMEGPKQVEDHGWPSLRSIGTALPVLVLAQIALGAAFRHRAMGILPHIVGAMLVTLAILIACMFVLNQFPGHRTLRSAAIALLSITLAQIMLGVTAYLTRLLDTGQQLSMVLATVTHVATGALTLAASIVLAIQIRRNVLPARVGSTASPQFISHSS